jgi:hypothetical protein
MDVHLPFHGLMKIFQQCEGWHLGTQSNAIAQVLYGDYNPSGKLPMTFPRNVGQVPIYYNYKKYRTAGYE